MLFYRRFGTEYWLGCPPYTSGYLVDALAVKRTAGEGSLPLKGR